MVSTLSYIFTLNGLVGSFRTNLAYVQQTDRLTRQTNKHCHHLKLLHGAGA